MQINENIPPESLRRRPLGRYRYVRLRWRILFSIVDAIGTSVFSAGRFALNLFSTCPNEKPKEPRRILIVQLDHLGDAIITTVMFPLLRRRYPTASIEVLCGHWNRQLFQSIGEVDRVHESRLNRFLRDGRYTRLKRFAWIAAVLAQGLRLRRLKFDLAIDVRGDFPNALMLRLAGAKRRLGWGCGGGGFLLTDVAHFVHNRPEVESRLTLLAELGISPADAEDAMPKFQPTDAARRSVAAKLESRANAGLSGSAENTVGQAGNGAQQCCERQLLVAVHVSAGTAAKRWPVEHWRRLTGMLCAAGARVVLVGGTADLPISQSICSDRLSQDIVNLTGRLDVVELAALLERADLFIGGDSGPAHLAAAVRTPTVALFSGTNDSRQWRPCGLQVIVVRHATPCTPCHREQCPRAAHQCMRNIDPAAVFQAAARLIPLSQREEIFADDRTPPTAANSTGSRRPPLVQGT